eukprot:sb/3478434/
MDEDADVVMTLTEKSSLPSPSSLHLSYNAAINTRYIAALYKSVNTHKTTVCAWEFRGTFYSNVFARVTDNPPVNWYTAVAESPTHTHRSQNYCSLQINQP